MTKNSSSLSISRNCQIYKSGYFHAPHCIYTSNSAYRQNTKNMCLWLTLSCASKKRFTGRDFLCFFAHRQRFFMFILLIGRNIYLTDRDFLSLSLIARLFNKFIFSLPHFIFIESIELVLPVVDNVNVCLSIQVYRLFTA